MLWYLIMFIFLWWLKTWLVTLCNGAEIQPSVSYKCIFTSGFRKQNMQRLIVMQTVFPQEASDKSKNSQTVGTLITAGSYPKCTVGEPNLIFFFFPQYLWHCSPTITLPRNTWQSALAARELMILYFLFFIWDYRDYYKTSNCPCSSVEDLNGAMPSRDLNLVFSTMSSQKLLSDVSCLEKKPRKSYTNFTLSLCFISKTF